jgi:hypothetical protein
MEQCTISVELSTDAYGIDGVVAQLVVDYAYHTALPGACEAGVPIEPDEPAHAEIQRVALKVGDALPIIITSYDEDALAAKCLEHAEA